MSNMLIPYLSHCFLCLMFFFGGGGSKGERERKLINLYLKFTSWPGACLIWKPASVFFTLRWMMIPFKINAGSRILFSRTNRMKKKLRHKGKLALFENNPERVFSHPLKQIAFFWHKEKRQAKFLKSNVPFRLTQLPSWLVIILLKCESAI